MAATTTTNDPTLGTTSDRFGGMQNMSEHVDAGRQQLGEATDRAASAARETVDRLADTAAETVERVSDSASQYASRFAETRERLLEDARDYIAAHPLRTLSIAAAAGFLIGRMMR
jgi:ElaB/YqjD/DUF883 family membrane-anchored ribosome-binding protein